MAELKLYSFEASCRAILYWYYYYHYQRRMAPEFGSCPRSLTFCPSCVNSGVKGVLLKDPPPVPKQELYQAWLRTLRCPDCSKQWYICTFCPRVRTHILDQTRLRLHWRTSHSERPRRARTAKTLLASDPPAKNNGFGVGLDTNEPVNFGDNTKFGNDTTTNKQEPVVETVGWSDDDGDGISTTTTTNRNSPGFA